MNSLLKVKQCRWVCQVAEWRERSSAQASEKRSGQVWRVRLEEGATTKPCPTRQHAPSTMPLHDKIFWQCWPLQAPAQARIPCCCLDLLRYGVGKTQATR